MYYHDYEKLTIPEAESIISGTFIQGSTSISGECITRSGVNQLLTASDKSLTEIYPESGDDKELVCWFSCQANRIPATSMTVDDVILYVGVPGYGETTSITPTYSPSGSTPDPDASWEITVEEGYNEFFDANIQDNSLIQFDGKKSTAGRYFTYTLKIGDISAQARVIVKDYKDMQPDLLRKGNVIALVYNLTTLGKNAGDIINVYRYDSGVSSTYPSIVWAASTEGYQPDGNNDINYPIKDVTNDILYNQGYFRNIKITEDMIVDSNKVVIYLQYDSTTSVPTQMLYMNNQVEKVYIPDHFENIGNQTFYDNQELTTIILGSGIKNLNQNALGDLWVLKDLYMCMNYAPNLINEKNSEGFTFASSSSTADKISTNVSVHVIDSTTNSWSASETDVWKWPGCFKAKTGSYTPDYGNMQGTTIYLEKLGKGKVVANLNTWKYVDGFAPTANAILNILYGRDITTGARKD